MSFATPWLLALLALLPLLWWLLRATPPAPKRAIFPPLRLLLGLHAPEETPARTPLWLLALRMLAAALLILGLAGPVLHPPRRLAGSGPVLLVIDNGWASAADWGALVAAARRLLARAALDHRPAALLATARGPDDGAPAATPPMRAALLGPRLAALHPQPWPPDRVASARALRPLRGRFGAVVYLADGLAGPGTARFARALAAAGPVREIRAPAPPVLLLPPRHTGDGLRLRLATLPAAFPRRLFVLAESGHGRALARRALTIAPGAAGATARLALPLALANRLDRLVLAGPPTAAGVVLLDRRFRRRLVGLASPDPARAMIPLAGDLYFLDRALAPTASLLRGSVAALLARHPAVLILADDPVPAGPGRTALAAWVRNGGLLLRFAGPLLAAHPDPLLPVALLPGERRLGGVLSWRTPRRLAPFPPASPFAGLHPSARVRVSRELLADPARLPAGAVWARLADGTPLITQARFGRGRIVLFHVSANAAWSDLPLSGLFPAMLQRLVALASGGAAMAGNAVLAPAETMDGFAVLGTPPPAARGLTAAALARARISPRHPPGLYGPAGARLELSLGAGVTAPVAAPPVPGARLLALGRPAPERALGPALVAAALALFLLDLIASLGLRGLLRPAAAALLLTFAAPAARAAAGVPKAALVDRLAYVVTGDPRVDALSRAGLAGLARFVDARTSALLAGPAAVVPGKSDLSLYPLLYWPITPAAPAPSPAAVAALNGFMGHGGILVIDTEGGDVTGAGSGAGFAPGVAAALQRATRGLDIPPLAPLTQAHVLAHSFYLLRAFPGRFAGARVWVAASGQRANDNVSPVILGANDWVAAWARRPGGGYAYATIPGGTWQRTLAFRFGVNLVMYALTGTYKADQIHVPAILRRLGR